MLRERVKKLPAVGSTLLTNTVAMEVQYVLVVNTPLTSTVEMGVMLPVAASTLLTNTVAMEVQYAVEVNIVLTNGVVMAVRFALADVTVLINTLIRTNCFNTSLTMV